MQIEQAAGTVSEVKADVQDATGVLSKLRNNEVAQSVDLVSAPVAGKSMSSSKQCAP